MRYSLALASAALCLSAGLASANIEYQCPNPNGPLLFVTIFDEENVAEVRFIFESTGVEQDYILPSAVAGSGFRYSDGLIEFVGQGTETATVTSGGASASCDVINITEPGGNDGTSGGIGGIGGFAGVSFGGNLRAGPGVEFADIGGTTEGEPVTLLRDTGVEFNGYTFWVIRLQNGEEAHQWGGILCAPGNELAGVFNDGC